MAVTTNKEGLFKKLCLTLLDLIYPEKGVCFICDTYDENINEEHWCPECKDKLRFISYNKCSICGKPLKEDTLNNKCYSCKKHPHYFSKAIAAVEYQGVIKKVIYKYKYGNRPYMYKALGPLLIKAIKDNNIYISGIDIIVPVPLHKSKIIKRGFNQSELLGKFIANAYNTPLSTGNLMRCNRTLIQNSLDRSQRYSNIKGAFMIKKKEEFDGKRVILVDDIFTTGATADECSKELILAGAKDVIVVTLATGRSN